MDWTALLPTLAKFGLPILRAGIIAGVGTIPVVGPFAGPLVADAIGNLIAGKLGVEATPEAVTEAIETQPTSEVLSKLQAAEAEASAKWPALAEIAKAEEETARTQITTTAQSMKQEVLAASELGESKWRTAVLVMNTAWRPLFALEFLLECFCFALLLGVTLVSNDQFDVDAVVKLWPLILPYMGARFGVIGYQMNLRTREKESVTEAVTDTSKPITMDEIKAMMRAAGVKLK